VTKAASANLVVPDNHAVIPDNEAVIPDNQAVIPDLIRDPSWRAMPPPYPTLLSPLRVGTHTLRNRVIMGSLHTRLENEPDAIERLKAFYSERARGGCSPNFEGRVEEGAQVLDSRSKLHEHAPVVAAVHEGGARIILQVLHTGINAKHPQIVGPGTASSPINRRTPRQLSTQEVEATVDDFVRCAELAREAGYDGVELMGSEGYLINQFTAPRTNPRDDEWGGSFENRIRFPVEVVRRVRERLGPGFLLMYRISAIDLVEGGLTGDEIDALALAVEAAGVDVFNTGIGWHESVVPTIATSVPRAAFGFAVRRLKGVVKVPVVASNRINMPDVAEGILARGEADLVSMARPFLADSQFVRKAAEGRPEDINTCIACNQACLDHIFTDRLATCLVNPAACHEAEFSAPAPVRKQRVAVVGSGPAGMACAATAAERGHAVVLFEAGSELGGQLNIARRIPGKEQEFNELLRYFRRRLDKSGVEVRLNTRADAAALAAGGFAQVVIATGITPRLPDIPGITHPKVLGYADVILGRVQVGASVAVIGMGGIAHDVAELLTSAGGHDDSIEHFLATWGVDPQITERGGLKAPVPETAARSVTLMQRGTAKPGSRLGKSTGWIHRTRLTRRGVKTLTGCTYLKVDDAGLHYSLGGAPQLLAVDHIVLCAGQEPEQSLATALAAAGVPVELIGGARFASELDAKRAIDEGTRLAMRL
jgi:2,4-dienoyl-CoA reductase (NADPH2)